MDLREEVSSTLETLAIIYLSIALGLGIVSCVLIIVFMRRISERAFKLPKDVVSIPWRDYSITRYYTQLVMFIGISDCGVVLFFIFRYWIHEIADVNVGHNPVSCRIADAFGLLFLSTSIWLIVFLSVEQTVHVLRSSNYGALFCFGGVSKYLIYTVLLDGGLFLMSCFSYQYVHDAPEQNSYGNVTYCRTTKIFPVTIWTTAIVDFVIPIIIISINIILVLWKYLKIKDEEEKAIATPKMTTVRAFIIYAAFYCLTFGISCILDIACFDRTKGTQFLYHQCSGNAKYSAMTYNVYHTIGLTGAQSSFIIHFAFWPPFRSAVCACREIKELGLINSESDDDDVRKRKKRGRAASIFKTSNEMLNSSVGFIPVPIQYYDTAFGNRMSTIMKRDSFFPATQNTAPSHVDSLARKSFVLFKSRSSEKKRNESQVTTDIKNEPEVTTDVQKEPQVPAAIQKEPQVTTATQKEPQVTTATQKEPQVTTATQKEPQVTTATQKEPQVTTAIQEEPQVTKDKSQHRLSAEKVDLLKFDFDDIGFGTRYGGKRSMPRKSNMLLL